MAREMSWSINHSSSRCFFWPIIVWIAFAGQFSLRGTSGKATVVPTRSHFTLKHQRLQSEYIWLSPKTSALWDLIQCKKLFTVHVLKVDANNPLLAALISNEKIPLFAVSMMCQLQCSGADGCGLNPQDFHHLGSEVACQPPKRLGGKWP